MNLTQSESHFEGAEASKPVPGALVVFSRRAPMYRVVTLPVGRPLVLGREDLGGTPVPDDRCSLEHATLSFENGRFTVTDLESRNGTFVNGDRVRRPTLAENGAVLRLGHTVMVLVDDVTRYLTGHVTVDRFVIGPSLQRVLDTAVEARRRGAHLLVLGETGAGKELVALRYGNARPGRFVPVNCANIPGAMADQQLFGATRGAYTDARADHEGFFLSADGGVVFLDEIAELSLDVQPKLLRTLENGEVQRLGENAPRKVAVCVVAASHQNLWRAVERGSFREDLCYRLSTDGVTVPPLRERPEEVPWLMQTVVEGAGRSLHATLVETALLRPWPGNVRELITQTTRATAEAARTNSVPVRAEHLEAEAGRRRGAPVLVPAPAATARARPGGRREYTREELVEALRSEGTIVGAGRKLGLHPTQIRRDLARHGLLDFLRGDPGASAEDDGDDEGGDT